MYLRFGPKSILWCLLALASCGAVLAAVFLHLQSRPPISRPVDGDAPGESGDVEQHRREWIERMHAHAPDVDWRAMDTATRAQARAQRAARAASNMPMLATSVPPGTWIERGANNWAGRISDVDYDAATDRLTVFAHGGQLWRTLRSSLDWQPLNDDRQFKHWGGMQHFHRLAGTPERWLVADDTQYGFFYSDDQSVSWTKASGFTTTWDWNETTYLVSRDAGGSQIYALVGGYNVADSAWEARLLASSDRGATFSNLGFVGTKEKSALFAIGQSTGLVYLLSGNVLTRIGTDNSMTPVATIANTPTQVANDNITLAGGVTTGATPTPFLFAFFETGTGTPTASTQVFRSLDAGASWAARGSAPTVRTPRVAAGASLHDPNLVFYGGTDLYRSTNGGQTFASVGDWTQYWNDPATIMHADINFITSFPDSAGNEVFYVGTDGGLYESTDGLATVRNLNLTGMRQAQYYGSYTGRESPYTISMGAQDQGYQRNPHTSSGLSNFGQPYSGDIGHLTSSDGGRTLWMSSVGEVELDPSPAAGGDVFGANPLPQWSFSSGSLQNALFLAPLFADPADPRVAWLGGGASTGGANHVVRLTWNGTVNWSGEIASNEGTFDFGGQVTALSCSPQSPSTFFAMADNSSSATSFFTTTTPLTAWTKTVTTLPQGHYFYGSTLVPDPSRANTLYVGGSGYSGPSVYISTDNGVTFNPMNAGLPPTLVYALAISPDGAHLFAATEVGPYYYDRANATWVDIGAGAPDNTYWDVDFVPALNVARFSTYGRGLWDYDMGGGDLIFRDGID